MIATDISIWLRACRFEAESDATEALLHDPQNVKAFMRRGCARRAQVRAWGCAWACVWAWVSAPGWVLAQVLGWVRVWREVGQQ